MLLHFGAKEKQRKQQLLLSQKLFLPPVLLCQRLLKVKRAWSPKKQPPSSPAPHAHAGVLVYCPYWAAREEIFGLNPAAFIMAPRWRTEKESDTIILALTSLSQHTWWASGEKWGILIRDSWHPAQVLLPLGLGSRQVCVLHPLSNASAVLLDWVKLQQFSVLGVSAKSVKETTTKKALFCFLDK